MSHRILIIEADEATVDGWDDADALEEQVRAPDVLAARTSVSQSLPCLKQAVFAGEEPAVILIGPTVPGPLHLARQLRAAAAKGHIIFVARAGRMAALQRELSRAPMIGVDWSLATAGEPSLPKQVADAIRGAQRRLKLRTTLDRANLQIQAPKAVDSAEYRRLVVSDHYLASLLTQAQDIIVSLDAAQRIMFLSAGAARLAGITAEAATGRTLKTTSLWSDAMASHLDAMQTASRSVTAEFALSLGDRGMLVETVFSAVRDERGSLIGTSLFMRDVTERSRQLEMERLAREEAESIGRLKDDFLTTLSHELRTPLNSILGWAQLLRMGSLSEEKRADGLAIIERNARHQARLIEDLLDVSNIVTGKLRLQLQPVGLRSIVDSAAEAALPAALAKGLTLTVTADVVTDLVSGDVHRLQQVMGNLLSNAIKFTPGGGSIRISVQQDRGSMLVSVADTGEGLSPAFLPHAFERFRQADSSITKKKGGLGLGLSIVRQLVEMHGGTITASSAGVGLGSTFTLALPVANAFSAPEKAPPAGCAACDLAPALRGLRILVVDDEPDALALVAHLFRNHGAVVRTADSAAHALQVIEAFDPQMLISDIGMPDVDGYELLRAIRSRAPNGAHLPAIALTAFADPANREKALSTGFQNHIGKPFEAIALLTMAADMANAAR